jgi:hypothetical protein
MRRLLLEWDDAPGCAGRLVTSNVVSGPSRSRTRAIIKAAFVPRFVQSEPPGLWKPVAALERAGWPQEALVPLHYYAAAAADRLIWDFVTEFLADRAARGQAEVRTADAESFIERAPAERFPSGRWSPSLTRRVAQGLLTTLRDFGVLAGAVKKRLTPLYLPTEAFAFIAMIRHELGVRGAAALADPVWKLFFLGETAVERFFVEAHQRKILQHHAAGSLARIEFPASTLHDYAHELAQRTH